MDYPLTHRRDAEKIYLAFRNRFLIHEGHPETRIMNLGFGTCVCFVDVKRENRIGEKRILLYDGGEKSQCFH